jgi:hypothetical protein
VPDPTTEAAALALLHIDPPPSSDLSWAHRANGQIVGDHDGDDPLADRIRSALLSTAEVKALPPPNALVEGYLNLDSLALMFGPSGVGKSFVAADIALHVSRGAWWQRRHPVQGGPVLYVVAEGAAGFGLRVEAWEQHNRMHQEQHPVRWLPWAVNIGDSAWAAALAAVCAELGPALIVLDTFARCIPGIEENSAKEIGQVIVNLDRLRRATGACILLVHHSGKDGTRGGRGSTALKGAMDTELELTGDSDRMTLHVRKQKDGPELPPTTFGLVTVDGTGSCAIGAPASPDPSHLPSGVAETLEALAAIDVPGGVSATAWRNSGVAAERTFYRHRHGLLEQGLVVNVGTDASPRYRVAGAVESEG